MAAAALDTFSERRTGADVVFDYLHEQIMTVELLPGAKLSEAEVASRMGVSRQPVREAFHRLSTLGLLLVQPQKATTVRKFSLAGIEDARFIRLAIEIELGRSAIENWSADYVPAFEYNIAEQQQSVNNNDIKAFQDFDEQFHRLIADIAAKPGVFAALFQQKTLIGRICLLSLKQAREMSILVEDHRAIYKALAAQDMPAFEAAMREHLSRITCTIEAVCRDHPEYFEAT